MIIKKTISILVCFIICCYLYAELPHLSIAQENVTEKSTESEKSGAITFRMGNDRWSNGLSYNLDDQKTFSLGISFDLIDFLLEVEAERYTNREDYDCYDLLIFSFSFPFKISNIFNAVAKSGLFIYGDLYLGSLQDLIHKIFGLYQHKLYYPDNIIIYPMAGFEMQLCYNIKNFILAAYLDLDFKPTFSSEEMLGVKVVYDGLTIFSRYSFMQSFINDTTLLKWIEFAHGIQLGYKIDKGVFEADYFVNPMTREGYANIGISIFKPYIVTDMNYTFGKVWYVFFQGRKKPAVSDFTFVEISRFNFFFQVMFNTGIEGKPMDNAIISLGYNLEVLKSLIFRPSIQYSRFTFQNDLSTSIYLSFRLELSYYITFSKHYRVNFMVAGNYFVMREFSPSFGISISLV